VRTPGQRVIRDDPAAFIRTVAQILPKEIDAAVNVNAGSDFDDCETPWLTRHRGDRFTLGPGRFQQSPPAYKAA
jgi:hypothetical protein